MAKFIGEYTAKVDDKGRLIFPAPFKLLSEPEEGERQLFVVKKDLYANCLQMFTYSEWEAESEQIKSRLNFFNKEHAQFWREYMRGRAVVEPDGKLGRISIPKAILAGIGVQKEVVFAGNDHVIEIWAKENYAAVQMSEDELAELTEKLLG